MWRLVRTSLGKPAIDVFSVAGVHHYYKQLVVLDGVDDSVIPHSEPIKLLGPLQLLCAVGPWILFK